ncbi:hypothetical protein Sjap_025084 [Stephania japonica]|uniref:Cystatin domain-containing protein n=1 Tax=Stephania japonica TaxID=461633 RepID=A0AAP0HDV4_9MAGN
MRIQSQSLMFTPLFLLLTLLLFHTAYARVLGGFEPIDPKDPHVIEIGRYAVDTHNKQPLTCTNNLKFVEVVSAERQILQGTNYRLRIRVMNGRVQQTYLALIFEDKNGQRALNSFKIIPLLGAFQLVDPRGPRVVEIGRYAVDEYNKEANKSLVFKSVYAAQVQVVAGRNYELIIKVADGGIYNANVSEGLNGQKTLKGFQVVRSLLGGYHPADPNDSKIVEIGHYAVQEYNNRTHMGLKFVNLIKADTQVVAGINYRLVIAARNKNDQVQYYDAVVLERAWESYKTLTCFEPHVNK